MSKPPTWTSIGWEIAPVVVMFGALITVARVKSAVSPSSRIPWDGICFHMVFALAAYWLALKGPEYAVAAVGLYLLVLSGWFMLCLLTGAGLFNPLSFDFLPFVLIPVSTFALGSIVRRRIVE